MGYHQGGLEKNDQLEKEKIQNRGSHKYIIPSLDLEGKKPYLIGEIQANLSL